MQEAEDAAAAQTDGDGTDGDGPDGDAAAEGARDDGGTPAGETAAEVAAEGDEDGKTVPDGGNTATEDNAKAADAETVKPAKRRRAPKLDPLLVASVDVARGAVLEIAPAEQIGEHATVKAEDDRVVTHLFESKLPGYEGWQWFAVLARVPRGKAATVSEVGLLPSERSLLAPEWVPWAKRTRPEEKEQADADQAEADAGSKQESGSAQQ